MRARNGIFRVLLVALLIYCLTLLAETNAAPAAVVVEYDRGRAHYTLGSKQTPSDDLLEALNRLKQQIGRKGPLVVLIDSRNSLATLANLRGIIEKAGFENVRYFFFTADHRTMEEIQIGQRPAVPFSLNPPPETRK